MAAWRHATFQSRCGLCASARWGEGRGRAEWSKNHALKRSCSVFPQKLAARVWLVLHNHANALMTAALPCRAARSGRPGQSRACGLSKVRMHAFHGTSAGVSVADFPAIFPLPRSGYAAATFLAGVRAANVGIIGGAMTGVGLFFGLEAFDGWRRRTGLAMAQQRARQKPLDDLHKAWSAGCLTRTEYAYALNRLQEEERHAEVISLWPSFTFFHSRLRRQHHARPKDRCRNLTKRSTMMCITGKSICCGGSVSIGICEPARFMVA